MKINKFTAIGATVALAISAVVGMSAAASAADDIYVPLDEIRQAQDGLPYPQNQWFVGDPAGPALTQDETGLTIEARNQLQYGETIPNVTSGELTTFVDSAEFDADGDLFFQIALYANGNFTTIMPEFAGQPSTTGNWIVSRAIGDIAEGVPVSFATILELIGTTDAGVGTDAGTVQIVSFGVFSYGEGNSALLRSVTWGDRSGESAQTWIFYTPEEVVPPVVPPVEAVVPTPIQDPATFTG